jgi:DNA-binding NarL/FixJ family response regulator
MDRTGMNTLTQRELDVVALLADGLTDDEIEERLGLPR